MNNGPPAISFSAKTALTYVLVGFAWILLSDFAVETLLTKPLAAQLSTVKGLGFVLFTGALLYGWLAREDAARRAQASALRQAHREAEADRERARNALERMRVLLDAVPLGVVEIDDRGHVTQLCQTAAEIVGQPSGDLLGASWLDLPLIEPRDEGDELLPLRHGVRGQSEIATPDEDNPRHVRWHAASLPGSTPGDGPAAVIFMEDVTESIDRQRVITRSRARLEAAERIGQTGHWTANRQRDELSWSAGTWRVFGLESDAFDLTYDAFMARVHEDDVDGLRKTQQRAITHSKPFEIHYRIRRGDGEVRWIYERGEARGEVMQGTIRDVTAEFTALQEAAQAARRVRSYTARAVQMREEERGRIAREVHDQLGQSITGLRLMLEAIRSDLEQRGADHSAERVRAAIMLCREVLEQVRDIATRLRPVVLDQFGLVAGIEWLADHMRTTDSTAIELCMPEERIELGESESAHVYRIVQEALTNALRHADASVIRIELSQVDDALVLSIADDGRGFEPDGGKRLGLAGMQERAHLLRGTLTIDSQPGDGTRIHLRVPTQTIVQLAQGAAR